VPKRNELVRGQVEVVTRDVLDQSKLVARADRWVIDCYITIAAKPALIAIEELPTRSQAITVYARKGHTVRVPFSISNRGEVPGDVCVRAVQNGEGVTLSNEKVILKPGETKQVTASIPPNAETAAGSHFSVTIEAHLGDTQVVPIPILVMVEGSFANFMRKLFRRNGASSVPLTDFAGARALPPPK
jgi:uncharacterized membrane protein